MRTWRDWPGFNVPQLQDSTPPAMLHAALSTEGTTRQVNPGGKVSVMRTLAAGVACVLLMTMVKPIWSPALTTGSSGTLMISTSPGGTTIGMRSAWSAEHFALVLGTACAALVHM